MKNRCVIVGGANINDYEYIKSCLKDDDYFIYCDSGLKHRDFLCHSPNLIVGDFDSYDYFESEIETIVLPREKDDTDSMYGIKEGIKRGFDEFIIIGVIGQRLDHTLANIYNLVYLNKLNKKAMIIDDYSEIEIVSKDEVRIDERYKYFSLVAITGSAKAVNIYNAKYPLVDATIEPSYQYGVSNEVEKSKVARVSVGEGLLLLIKDR